MSVIRHRTKYRIISVGAASLVLPPCGPLAEQSGLQRSKLSRSSITTNPVVLSFVDASFLSVPLDLRPCQEPLHVSNGHWCLSSSRFYMAKHLWPGAHLTQSLDYACYSGLIIGPSSCSSPFPRPRPPSSSIFIWSYSRCGTLVRRGLEPSKRIVVLFTHRTDPDLIY